MSPMRVCLKEGKLVLMMRLHDGELYLVRDVRRHRQEQAIQHRQHLRDVCRDQILQLWQQQDHEAEVCGAG